MQVYKIMSGIDRVDPSLLFTPADYQGTRGHSQKFQKQRSRLDLRHTFFSQRVVQDWNSLPEEVVSCTWADPALIQGGGGSQMVSAFFYLKYLIPVLH